jgi:hypothetical protein
MLQTSDKTQQQFVPVKEFAKSPDMHVFGLPDWLVFLGFICIAALFSTTLFLCCVVLRQRRVLAEREKEITRRLEQTERERVLPENIPVNIRDDRMNLSKLAKVNQAENQLVDPVGDIE